MKVYYTIRKGVLSKEGKIAVISSVTACVYCGINSHDSSMIVGGHGFLCGHLKEEEL